MTTSIQRFPAGLLELLGSKVGGDNPAELGAVVAPTLDLAQCYGLSNVTEQNAGGPTVAGAGQIIRVPQGGSIPLGLNPEWWLLYALSARIAVSATQTGIHVSLGINRESSAPERVSLAWGAIPTGAPTGTSVTIATWTPPYPMLLPPATTLWAVLESLGTDANSVLGIQARYSVLTP